MRFLQCTLSLPVHLALCLPLQVKLSRLCEQDKILKDLEARISSLKEDKVKTLLVTRFIIVNGQNVTKLNEMLDDGATFKN